MVEQDSYPGMPTSKARVKTKNPLQPVWEPALCAFPEAEEEGAAVAQASEVLPDGLAFGDLPGAMKASPGPLTKKPLTWDFNLRSKPLSSQGPAACPGSPHFFMSPSLSFTLRPRPGPHLPFFISDL